MDTQTIAFLQNLSSWEIILIFLVVLLFFGAKRLPDLFRSFGKSLKEFKQATSDIENDFRNAMDEEDEPRKTSKGRDNSKKPATTAPREVATEEVAEELESDDIPESDKKNSEPDLKKTATQAKDASKA